MTSNENRDQGLLAESDSPGLAAHISACGPISPADAVSAPPARGQLQLHHDLFETLPLMCFVLDRHGTVVNANALAAEGLGYAPGALIGRAVWDCFHDESKPEAAAELRAALASPGAVRTVQLRRVRADGSALWTQETMRAVAGEDGEPVVINLCDDVTQRVVDEAASMRYRRELKALAVELSLVEERMRRRIAEVLHSDVGHRLATVKILLDSPAADASPLQVQAAVDSAVSRLGGAIQAVRSLTYELCSPVLYELGLEPALHSLTERVAAECGVPCAFTTDGRARSVSEDAGVILYRIVQELLVNVAKHAAASTIGVTVTQVEQRLVITVADDGVGVGTTSSAALTEGGFGLFSIRERLDHLGGDLQFESPGSGGTRAVVRVPLDGAR